MIHIYSGNGKGKTTAGFGLVLRMAGYGKQIGVAQFLKDGTSGELRALRALHGVSLHATDMPKGFYFQMNEADQKKTGQAVLELFAWVQKHASVPRQTAPTPPGLFSFDRPHSSENKSP